MSGLFIGASVVLFAIGFVYMLESIAWDIKGNSQKEYGDFGVFLTIMGGVLLAFGLGIR
jgi:hypothetical protein